MSMSIATHAFAAILVEAAAKGTVLLAAAAIATVVSRRRSTAAVRHLIWSLAIAGTLILPAISATLPSWNVLPSLWNAGGTRRDANGVTPAVPTMIPVVSRPPAPTAAAEHADTNHPGNDSARPPVGERSTTSETAAAGAFASRVDTGRGVSIDWILAAWLAGFSAVMARWLLGRIWLHRLARGAGVLRAGPIADSAAQAMRELHVRRPTDLLTSPRCSTPMTWGVIRPKVLLPAGLATWPAERRRLALLHELAHVKRYDALTQAIACLTRAVYWFNPLAWLASRALAREQEHAADDLVLDRHRPASDYAQFLLDVVTDNLRAPAGAIAMARPGTLERRVRAILDGDRPRGRLNVRHLALGVAAAFAVILPIAALSAQAPRAAEKSPTYAGRILTPDGKPAAGAHVFLLDLTLPTERQQIAATQAGADGKFHFDTDPNAHPTGITFVAVAPGFAAASVFAFAGDDPENEITLAPPTTVRVTFLDPGGHPVAGLRVTPTMAFARAPSGDFSAIYFPADYAARLARQTNAAGAVTFADVPRGHGLRLEIADPRFARLTYADEVRLANEPTSPPATVRLQRGGSISGVVRYGPTGQPAAGIRLVAGALSRTGVGAGWGAAVTDARGEYRMDQIAAGDYNVAANFNDDLDHPWAAAALENVHVGDGQNLAGQDLTLVKGGLLTGHVVRADTGARVPEAYIGVYGPDHPKSTGMISGIKTDATGAYALRVAPGAQYVYLSGRAPDGYRSPKAADVTVADGQTVVVDFTLEPKPGKPVTGHVEGPDGKPVAGANVAVESPTGRMDDLATTTTDALGNFFFRAVGPNSRLRAGRGSLGTWRPVAVNGGEEDVTLEITRRVPHAVSGLVTDPQGKPIAGARVQVITHEGQFGTGMGRPELTDAAGRYTIKGLVPDGRYSLAAEADDFGEGGAPLKLDPEQDVTQAQTIHLDPLTARIAGRVVDSQNQPLAGIRVEINGAGNGNRRTTTDAAGHFSFKVLDKSVPLIFLRDLDGNPQDTQAAVAGNQNIILKAAPLKRR